MVNQSPLLLASISTPFDRTLPRLCLETIIDWPIEFLDIQFDMPTTAFTLRSRNVNEDSKTRMTVPVEMLSFFARVNFSFIALETVFQFPRKFRFDL